MMPYRRVQAGFQDVALSVLREAHELKIVVLEAEMLNQIWARVSKMGQTKTGIKH